MLCDLYQSFLITILNSFYTLTKHMSERIRERMVFACCFILSIFFILDHSPVFWEYLLYKILPTRLKCYFFCTVILCIMVILSIKTPLQKIQWRKTIFYAQFFLGVGIIIISHIHSVGSGYRLFGYQMTFIFPAFYLVWNNRRDYTKLFRYIAYSIVIVRMVFYGLLLVLSFSGSLAMQGTRCKGIMFNSNSLSLVGLALLLCSAYLLITEKKNYFTTTFLSMGIGMGLGIIVMGQMRIAIITVFISAFIFLLFYFRYCKKYSFLKEASRLFLGLFMIIAMFTLSVLMLNINEAAIEKKKIEVSTASIGTTYLLSYSEGDETIIDRLIPNGDEDMNRYSSGRIQIWKNFAAKLNWFGNNYDEENIPDLTGTDELPYAHNILIEIAFRCGILIGVIMLLYMLCCGIVCLKFLFSSKGEAQKYTLFPIIAMVTFTLESMLDCAVLPFFQLESFLFYISVAMMIDKTYKEKNERISK